VHDWYFLAVKYIVNSVPFYTTVLQKLSFNFLLAHVVLEEMLLGWMAMFSSEIL